LFIGAALFISSLRRSPTRPIIEPRAAPHEWNSASQSKLVEYLREHSGHDENVEVQFAAMQHKPLADTLASVFSLAGWDAQVSPPVSLESFLNEYFAGILVGGHNRHLVEYVAEGLRAHGLQGVVTEVDPSPAPNDAMKQKRERHIKIRIGHH
jgi:hypothetical protein